MIIEITERTVQSYNVPFSFPIFRMETIDEDEHVYWKFESHHKVTRIHEKIGETSILAYDDKSADFIKDMITSENMLYGRYQYDIIPEKIFDSALERLINTIHRA
jgi:hypothetical protein